jgi:PDZ domain-containing protein
MSRSILSIAIAVALSAMLATYPVRAVAQQSDNSSKQGSDTKHEGAASDRTSDSSAGQQGRQQDAQSDSRSEDREEAGNAPRRDREDRGTENQREGARDQDRPSQEQSRTTDRDRGERNAPPADRSTSPRSDEREGRDQSRLRDSEGRDREGLDQPRERDGRDRSLQGRADGVRDSQRSQRMDIERGIRFDRSRDRGLSVLNVEQNSVFFRSGFRRGDVIVSVDGRAIRTEDDFRRFVFSRERGRVPVIVLREGVRETIYIESDYGVADRGRTYEDGQNQTGGQAVLGVRFDPRYRDAAVVRSVTPGGPADQAGLQPGDEIVALNREPVRSPDDVIDIVRSMRPGDRVSIAFERRMETETEAVLGGQGETAHTSAYPPDVVPVQDQRINVDRRDREDQRGILNRNRNDNRPLRPRLVD